MASFAALAWAGVGLLGVGFTLAWVVRRARRPTAPAVPALRAAAPPSRMHCPSCQRAFPPGMTFCPADARKLVAATDGERRNGGLHCPRCRRAFDENTRFCPFDAEELKAQPSHAGDPLEHDHDHDHSDGGIGKICPVCAAKYGLEAVFCGRDGSELMTVN